jgi:hypothetical protein
MIAVKNFQNLNECLVQEELLQSLLAHYIDTTTDKQIASMFQTFLKTSQKNHADILDYLQGDLGKSPLPKSSGVLNKGGKK